MPESGIHVGLAVTTGMMVDFMATAAATVVLALVTAIVVWSCKVICCWPYSSSASGLTRADHFPIHQLELLQGLLLLLSCVSHSCNLFARLTECCQTASDTSLVLPNAFVIASIAVSVTCF